MRIINTFFIKLIRLYQITISPDNSKLGKARYPYGYCRQYPSCSNYAIIQLKQNNVFIAIFRIIKRIIKCNPCSPISVDSN